MTDAKRSELENKIVSCKLSADVAEQALLDDISEYFTAFLKEHVASGQVVHDVCNVHAGDERVGVRVQFCGCSLSSNFTFYVYFSYDKTSPGVSIRVDAHSYHYDQRDSGNAQPDDLCVLNALNAVMSSISGITERMSSPEVMSCVQDIFRLIDAQHELHEHDEHAKCSKIDEIYRAFKTDDALYDSRGNVHKIIKVCAKRLKVTDTGSFSRKTLDRADVARWIYKGTWKHVPSNAA